MTVPYLQVPCCTSPHGLYRSLLPAEVRTPTIAPLSDLEVLALYGPITVAPTLCQPGYEVQYEFVLSSVTVQYGVLSYGLSNCITPWHQVPGNWVPGP
jgi:hypothetical protein